MRANADRFCRNPYFLHSVVSANAGADNMSYKTFNKGTSKMSGVYPDAVTMSEYGGFKMNSKRRSKASRMGSEGGFDTGMGAYGGVPNLRKKKIRPYSAPRHQQGFRRKAVNAGGMGPNILMSQQQVNYARGGHEQEVQQLMEAAREDEEEEQLVYADGQQQPGYE